MAKICCPHCGLAFEHPKRREKVRHLPRVKTETERPAAKPRSSGSSSMDSIRRKFDHVKYLID